MAVASERPSSATSSLSDAGLKSVDLAAAEERPRSSADRQPDGESTTDKRECTQAATGAGGCVERS